MSQPDLSSANAPRGVLVQRPKASVYTVMLVIALLAILLASLFLWLEIGKYGGLGQIKGKVSSVTPASGPGFAGPVLA